jgi:transitional endoplasmic reticulum ATPase
MADSSFLYSNYKRYLERANDEYKQGNYKTAKKFYLRSADQLLKLAKTQKGTLKQQTEARAMDIYEKAVSIKTETSDSLEIEISSQHDDKEQFSGNRENESNGSFKAISQLPDITFDDVIGLEDVKKFITNNVIKPFEVPHLYEVFKQEAGGGVLLYGPPGTGKTMMAKAIANRIDAAFYHISSSDILRKWVGSSEQNIRQLFDAVHKEPLAVLFIDEVDQLTSNRDDQGTQAMNRVVAELLAQLDGFETHENNVTLFLAATNKPESIDPAFLRPGRFDRKIYVPLPTPEERRQIIEMHLDGIPHEEINMDVIIEGTARFSGADIVRGLIKEVKSMAIERSDLEGVASPITTDDFLTALLYIKPTANENLIKQYDSFANH